MARGVAILGLLAALLSARQQPKPIEPPEEDETFQQKEYSFNPLQAEKEFKVGDFYWKKGSYKAAALRYEEATRWDPSFAEAWLKWAEALEKAKEPGKAREVYAKFLKMAPDHRRAGEVRKKLTAPRK